MMQRRDIKLIRASRAKESLPPSDGIKKSAAIAAAPSRAHR